MFEAARETFGATFAGFCVAGALALVLAVASLALNDRRVGFWFGVATVGVAVIVFALGSTTAASWLGRPGLSLATAGARSATAAKTALVVGAFPALVGVIAVLGASRRRLRPESMRAPRPYSSSRRPVTIAAIAFAAVGVAVTATFALLPLARGAAGREEASRGVRLLEDEKWDEGCREIESARARGFGGLGVPAWPGAVRQCFELRFENALQHEGEERRALLEQLVAADLAPTDRDRARLGDELGRTP